LPEEWLDKINGAIVIVGNHTSGDVHPTADGKSYGVDLQANYIAALLDQRYYLVLSSFQNGIVVVIFFIILQILLWKYEGRLKALIYAILLWLVMFILSIGVLAFTGYLVNIWVQEINF